MIHDVCQRRWSSNADGSATDCVDRRNNEFRSYLHAVMPLFWVQDLLDALPSFPKVKPQWDAAR